MVSITSSTDEYEYEYEYDCDECELDAVTLPPRFTEHRLDHHNDPARQAAEALHQVARDLTTVHRTLRPYARAPQESKPHSQRASRARDALREAIDTLDSVDELVDSAHIYLLRPPDRHPAAETNTTTSQQVGCGR